MDKQPQHQHESAAELQEQRRAKRLLRHVRQLENHLKAHWTDTNKTDKLIDCVAKDVGYDMVDRKAHLLAVGYTYDSSGYVDPTPLTITTDNAYYKGVIVQEINGDDRAMLSYEVHDPQDETIMWPYCIAPKAVLCNEIDSTQINFIAEHITNNRILAKDLFEKTNFFDLNPEQQHMLLRKKVAEELIADISLDYDDETPVTIGCQAYYQMYYSDVDAIDWRERKVDGGTLEGVILQVVYLESLQDTQAHFATKQDFVYGHGLPCLVLSNDERETISFIPVEGITTLFGANDVV
jgi:hypothetical protein